MTISIATVTIVIILAFAPADNAANLEFPRLLNASGELKKIYPASANRRIAACPFSVFAILFFFI